MKFYCGIGSRNTPKNILMKMTKYASILERMDFVLRSGGAIGADLAFEKGVKNYLKKEIFLAEDAENWAEIYVKKCMPSDRPPYEKSYVNWKPYVKNLLARNMMQVLGKDGETPVKFILCWTPEGDYSDSSVGGTGYALRCALLNNIPIFNLNSEDQENNFKNYLRNLLLKK